MRQLLTRIRNWFWDTLGYKDERLEQERLRELREALKIIEEREMKESTRRLLEHGSRPLAPGEEDCPPT